MKTRSGALTSMLLLIGVVILINIVAARFHFRLDFTADQRYTLSNATKNILARLNDPVTIKAYFSENLPPDVSKTRKDFKELLLEYESLSGGNVVFEFIDPSVDEESEREALQAGIQPVVVNLREKDQVMQQKVYMGAVLEYGKQADPSIPPSLDASSSVIPFLEPGAAMEYALSTSIQRLAGTNKAVIGFLQGHGEPSINALAQVYQQLDILYNIEPVSINDTTPISARYKTVVVIAPSDTFPMSHLQYMDSYLANGGNLLIAYNSVRGDFSTAMGNSLYTGLEDWLARKGLVVESNFVIDASCGSITIREGFFGRNIRFPYLPIMTNFAEHTITDGLEAVMMQFPSRLSYKGDTSLTFTPLVWSSDKSNLELPPVTFDIRKKWSDIDFPLSHITVAGILTGKLSGGQYSRMVVFADGDFAVNGEGQAARQVQADNSSLLANAVDWLSDDTGLIELRTKGVTSRPLDQLDDATKTWLKYLNFLLPLFLVVLYGIYRVQFRRIQRLRRMAPNYV